MNFEGKVGVDHGAAVGLSRALSAPVHRRRAPESPSHRFRACRAERRYHRVLCRRGTRSPSHFHPDELRLLQ
jgi:hypothetical protein